MAAAEEEEEEEEGADATYFSFPFFVSQKK